MGIVKIRVANENDLSSILELYQGIEEDNSLNSDIETAKKQLRRIQSYPNYAIYVAEKDGDIVGTFELLIMDNLAHYGRSSAIVEDVVVKEELRGAGIGKEMMLFAMQTSRQQGCYKLMLSSNIKRERTHKFYDDLGFEIHGYSFRVDL